MLFFIDIANAIPAFARKYKFSCTTCHVNFPKLKDYGEEFAGNGFMVEEEQEPKRAYVKTGDDNLRLMKELPLAVRLDGYVQVSDRDNVKTDLQTPYGLKLLSGGPIAKNISYYFYFYISERGEVAGIEDAIVHFNNIADTEFDLALGQFQVSDPLFKRELRFTFEDYMIYKRSPGLSQANLTYDRGLMATYGTPFGLDLTAMIINGNGIKEAGSDRLFDFDSDKSFALRALKSIDFINIGIFAYSAKETITDSLSADNEIIIFGPDITIGNDKLELNVQYLRREDDNPNFTGEKTTLDGGFAEFIYMPKGDQSSFLFTALYNYIDGTGDLYDYETVTLNITHMVARNFKLLGEFTYDRINEQSIITAGFVSAF
jgi:hypothetical protein